MPTLLEPLETAEYEVKALPLETSAETQPPVVLDVPNFEVPIFAEMLLETTTAQRRRRKLAAVLSFGFQVLFDHDRERGMALLRKTQAVCLVSKALAATKHFEPEVAVKQSVAFGVVP